MAEECGCVNGEEGALSSSHSTFQCEREEDGKTLRGLKNLSSGCITMTERVYQAGEDGGWGAVAVVMERGRKTPGECKSGRGHLGERKMPK